MDERLASRRQRRTQVTTRKRVTVLMVEAVILVHDVELFMRSRDSPTYSDSETDISGTTNRAFWVHDLEARKNEGVREATCR